MPTLATGNNSGRLDAGFSLVEALTTLLIVALAVGAVMLMTPGPDRRSRESAERLAATLVMATEESITINKSLALSVTNEGYGYSRLEPNGWLTIDDASPLSFRSWPPGVDGRVEDVAGYTRDNPRVTRIDPIGEVAPARIVVSGGGAWWIVEIDARGVVRVHRSK